VKSTNTSKNNGKSKLSKKQTPRNPSGKSGVIDAEPLQTFKTVVGTVLSVEMTSAFNAHVLGLNWQKTMSQDIPYANGAAISTFLTTLFATGAGNERMSVVAVPYARNAKIFSAGHAVGGQRETTLLSASAVGVK